MQRVLFNTFVVIVLAANFAAWVYPGFARVPVPCKEPIAYVIGTFDQRFGISKENFLAALSSAEAIWEKPLAKELFVYAPESADLTVNLIYDYRQETTSTLSEIESVVEEDEATYEALEAKYASLKAEYNSAKSVYDARVVSFDSMNSTYDAKVRSWNEGDRTSRNEFEELESYRVALEAEASTLRTMEARLNDRVREINTLVGRLNRLATSLNLNAKAYNTIGATRGETYTGGLYSNIDGRETIDIFEFSSSDKLVRILAHELGHALGLEHNDDPKAIMYYLNEGDVAILAGTDLSALQALCYNQ